MKSKVYLSIGTNMGDRAANLKSALALLRAANVEVIKVSNIYETEPVGGVKQDDFLNIAVEVATDLTAEALLQIIHSIETELHRKRLVHWGPRTIDLDILFFNNENISTEALKVPHPEIPNRKFVLVPLLEIMTPTSKLYPLIQKYLEQTTDTTNIQIYKPGSD